MADGLYLAMAGATARSAQLDSIADNLANAETPGFKAARPAFQSFLAPSGAPEEQYVAAIATGIDLRPGPTSTTGNALDVLPEDGGYLVVQTGSGVAFTRNGRLALDASGVLTAAGAPVLSLTGKPFVVPPGAKVSIAPDGTVFAAGQPMDRLGMFRLEGAVDRLGTSLLAPNENGRAVAVESRVRTGEIELGNAGPLESTVQMISAQRHFDAAMQALQTYKTMDDRTTDLGKVR
ncbi:MAG TPA: flagellar hook basal-body protein [Myxococcaceae bacterium]|nr:flagellar hook basal-body protein [Myxococcaceae bacterium]